MSIGPRNPRFEKWSATAIRENNDSFCEGWFVEFAGTGFNLQPRRKTSDEQAGVCVRLDDSRSWVRLWQPLQKDQGKIRRSVQLTVSLSIPPVPQTSGILQWVALLTTDPSGKRIFHRKLMDTPAQVGSGGTITLDCVLDPSDLSRDLLLSLQFSGGPGQFELGSVTTRLRPHTARGLGRTPQSATTQNGWKQTKVCIVSPDMASDDDRAISLAEMASKSYIVELIGPSLSENVERRSTDSSSIRRRTFPATDTASFLEGAAVLARNSTCDIVHVVKPNLTSLVIGHLIRQRNKCPMIVDMDGGAIAHVEPYEPADFDEVMAAVTSGDMLDDDLWMRLSASLLAETEMTTVSNLALQQRFGGFHVRAACDEVVFDPGNFDRHLAREAFGYGSDDHVILFHNQPSQHRAIVEVAAALERIGDSRLVICVIGGLGDPVLAEMLQVFRTIRVDLKPDEPRDRMAELVNLADAVASLPASHHPSELQFPVHLAAGLAMGVMVLARTTPPLKDIALSGAYTQVFDDTSLDLALMSIGQDKRLRGSTHASRDYFLSEMSYAVNAARLDKAYEAVLTRPPVVTPLLDVIVDLLSQRNGPKLSPPLRRPVLRREDAPRDLVFLWKQNDSDLYGRRPDMLAQQFLRSGKVARIIHLDAPISLEELERMAEASIGQIAHHGGAIYANAVRRILRQADTPRLLRRTFLYRGKAGANRAFGRILQDRESYPDFIRQLIKEDEIQPNPLLWISPIAPDYAAVMEALDPRLVVADLIDDQRVFPGSSDESRRNAELAYGAVLRDADIVLANCEPLKAALSHLRSDIHVVSNGSDAVQEDLVADIDVASLPHPIIGYVGNLRDRINVPLLERIARAYPDGSVVLVGSTHGRSDINDLARRNRNIRLLGMKPYPQALRIIKAFDVAVMPHLKNEQTDHMNPLKLYVYTSVGTPTVSSSVANIDDVAPYVHLASDDDDFLRKIDVALQGTGLDALADARKTILERHSWERRVEAIWDLLAPTAP